MIRSPFILVFISSVAHAQPIKISAFCPEMDVFLIQRFRPNIWECAKEIGVGKATMPDGSTLTFPDFEIKPTLVINHMVQPCIQFGHDEKMNQLHISLPTERVILGVAKPMLATCTLTLHTGEEYTGMVYYPASKSRWVGIGHRRAAAVLATGTVQ